MNLDIDLPVFYIKLIHYLITKMTFALGYNLIPSGTGANQVCIDTYGLFVSKLMRNYRSGLDQIFTKVNNDVLIKNDSFVFKMSGLNENICIEHKVRFIPISEYELYNIDDNGIYKVFNNDNIIKILDKECGTYNLNCKGILIKRIMSIILNDRHDEFSYLSNIDPMTLDDINPFYIDSIDATEVYKLVKEEIKDLKQILMDDFELKKLYEDTILISEKKDGI